MPDPSDRAARGQRQRNTVRKYVTLLLTIVRTTAAQSGGNYDFALAAVAVTVAIVIAVPAAVGAASKGIIFGKARA